MRELGEMRLEVGRVDGLQRLADLAVQLDPAGRREPVIRGVADQGVGEAHAAGRAGNLRDHARRIASSSSSRTAPRARAR